MRLSRLACISLNYKNDEEELRPFTFSTFGYIRFREDCALCVCVYMNEESSGNRFEGTSQMCTLYTIRKQATGRRESCGH